MSPNRIHYLNTGMAHGCDSCAVPQLKRSQAACHSTITALYHNLSRLGVVFAHVCAVCLQQKFTTSLTVLPVDVAVCPCKARRKFLPCCCQQGFESDRLRPNSWQL